jgi:hypothetical protein
MSQALWAGMAVPRIQQINSSSAWGKAEPGLAHFFQAHTPPDSTTRACARKHHADYRFKLSLAGN